jgi:hypothetical protein
MSTNPRFILLPWRPALLCALILFLLAGCGVKDRVAGTYQAEGQDPAGQVETILELKPKGDGAWKTGGEEIPFSWYLKGSELRINTRGGGVIVGQLQGDAISLTLPGRPRMTFRKIRQP